MFDWNRVGLDGKPRTLHIEQSLRSIDFNDFEPELLHPREGQTVLADSDEFLLLRQTLHSGETLRFAAGEQPRILSVASGSLSNGSSAPLARGDNVLLPYAGTYSFTATEPSVVLVTERFVG